MSTPRTIDLNADAGEGFGRWALADEDALFPHLTSVNLACGFHAGDPLSLRASLGRAGKLGVAVGAHPGYRDLAGFGRRDLGASPEEVTADVVYQIGALDALARAEGLRLHHVKPHGALYLRAMRDPSVARAVAEAVALADPELPLVLLAGPGGAAMREAAEARGLRAVAEAFPDRGYLADGSLAPRTTPGALLEDPADIAARAVRMARGEPFEALDGGEVVVEAETLCLHGDQRGAPESAAALRRALADAGVEVRAF